MHYRRFWPRRASPALAQGQPIDAARLEATNPNPNDWLSYHGTYKGYDYSGLDQINASNVKNLQVAWMHFPGRTTRGIQSMPLAKDGVLYYSGSYSRVFALDGATGKVLWTYFPELDDQIWSRGRPTRRTTAAWRMGDGKLYVGTVDGRLIALDIKTGKPAWDTKLIDSQKLTVGFTGAPLSRAAPSSSAPGRRMARIAARSSASTRRPARRSGNSSPSGGTPEAKKTWGNDTWRIGGGGGWMPGTYDPQTNTVWWGTANPAPLYDWAGADWKNDRRAARRQPLHHVGDRARSRHRQAQILPPGTAARRLGLRQRGRRVHDRSTATASS